MKAFIFTLILGLFSFPLFSQNTTSKRIKTRVIINPKSGTESKENIKESIHKLLNQSVFDYEIFYTTGPNHATKLSREAVSLGYGLVIAVGGDGTINEVGKGLIKSDTKLGIIPSGSGNGFANHLRIPSNPEKAIQIINDFHIKAIDTVQINDGYFLGIAGVGFDAEIAWKFAESEKRGLKSYASLILQNYRKYIPQTIGLEINGKKIRTNGLVISFANSSQYGNDIKIAPQAKLDDGNLHIAIMKDPPFYAIPRILMKLRNGTIAESKYYQSMVCKEVKINKKNLVAHIDGEPAFYEHGVNLKVLPKSLKVICPSKI